jgi:hypothetical protein
MNSGPMVGRFLASGVTAAVSASVVFALADVSTPLSSPLGSASLAGAPTAVIASWLRSLDIFPRVVVACTAALALNALMADSTLALGTWSPRMGLIAVLLVCAVGLTLELRAVRDVLISHRWAPHPVQTTER